MITVCKFKMKKADNKQGNAEFWYILSFLLPFETIIIPISSQWSAASESEDS